MIDIPFWLLLIPYLLAVGIFFLLLFFHLYHIRRFGFWDGITIFILTTFFLVTFFILGGTALLLRTVDWSDTFQLSIPALF
jgi:hypothetical protein